MEAVNYSITLNKNQVLMIMECIAARMRICQNDEEVLNAMENLCDLKRSIVSQISGPKVVTTSDAIVENPDAQDSKG